MKWPLQRDMPTFYGNPFSKGWVSANIVTVPCPWGLNGHPPGHSTIQIHKKCAASLKAVLSEIWDVCGKDAATISHFRMDRFSGSFVLRNMRGSKHLSCHAYGAALDFDADDNQFHSTKHFFNHDHPAVTKFIESGWIWGGDWSPGSIDAMHFQAARVHA